MFQPVTYLLAMLQSLLVYVSSFIGVWDGKVALLCVPVVAVRSVYSSTVGREAPGIRLWWWLQGMHGYRVDSAHEGDKNSEL